MKQFLKRYIEKLLCLHSWEVMKEGNVYEHEGDTMPSYTKMIVVCTKCGKIKKLKF